MRHDIDSLQRLCINVGYVEVYLNGELLAGPDTAAKGHIISFDERAGEIERYVCASNGKVLVEEDHFVTETLKGRVEAYAVRQSDGKWPHDPHREPDGYRVRILSFR